MPEGERDMLGVMLIVFRWGRPGDGAGVSPLSSVVPCGMFGLGG